MYHVVSGPKGGWQVRKEGASRATACYDTKDEAVSRAKEISKKSGFGVKIHNRDGRIVQTSAHGHDPLPPKADFASAASGAKASKSERIEIRTTPGTKALLQRAASVSHKNVTEFLLEAGITAAEEALVDRRLFQLDAAAWQAFQDALDRPVTHKPRLAKLLSEKSVLE